MIWNRVFASLLLALSLALCGCTATSLAPEAKQATRTVGIISAIGDDLTYRNLRLFIWNREEYHKDVSVWAIDSFVTDEVSGALRPYYSVVPVDFDRAPFLDKALYRSVSSTGSIPDAGPIGEIVRAQVRNPAADLYLVVLRGRMSVGLTRSFAEGMGVLRYPAGSTDRYYYHAVYRIAVVDGRSFAPVAILDAANDEKYPQGGLIHGSPYEEFDRQHWAEKEERVTVEQIAWIMEGIKGLFARTLPATLRRLNVLTSQP